MELKRYGRLVKSLGGRIIIKETSVGNIINILNEDNINICANTRWDSNFLKKNDKFFEIRQKMSMDKDLRKDYII